MDIKDLPKVDFEDNQTSEEIIKALERVRLTKENLGNCQLKIMMDRFYTKANKLLMDDMAEEYQQAEAAHYDESDIDPHARRRSPKPKPKTTEIDNRN